MVLSMFTFDIMPGPKREILCTPSDRYSPTAAKAKIDSEPSSSTLFSGSAHICSQSLDTTT
jgi:hypothetical protein